MRRRSQKYFFLLTLSLSGPSCAGTMNGSTSSRNAHPSPQERASAVEDDFTLGTEAPADDAPALFLSNPADEGRTSLPQMTLSTKELTDADGGMFQAQDESSESDLTPSTSIEDLINDLVPLRRNITRKQQEARRD